MKSIQRSVIHTVIKTFRQSLFIHKTNTSTHRSSFERLSRFTKAPKGVDTKKSSLGEMNALWCTPKGADEDRVILYLHGGGYCVGSAHSHRNLVGRIARAAGCKAVAVDYRLAPENPYPGALDDAVKAYKALTKFRYKQIYIAGDSAGGGLSLALMMRLRDEQYLIQPAGAMLLSPWSDLTMTGESLYTKKTVDPLIDPDLLSVFANKYIGADSAKNPLISPLLGDLSDLPPVFIQVGGHEVILDDSTRLAKKLMKSGNDVEIEVWEGMMHVWQYFGGMMPEANKAIKQIGRFVKRRSEALEPSIGREEPALFGHLKIA